nr:hypothetical protein [Yersinia frederiksenii]
MNSVASRPGLPTMHRYVAGLSCTTAFLLGIGLPTSNFIMNLSLVLALICVLLNRDTRYVKTLAKNPLIWLPAITFLLLAISLLWHHNLYGNVMVSKYLKLLYIFPLALFFFTFSLTGQFFC